MIAVLHNLNLCLMTEISRIFFVIVIRKCLIVIIVLTCNFLFISFDVVEKHDLNSLTYLANTSIL